MAAGTNAFLPGSDIAFSRYAVTSLANGNNAAVPTGTNVFVEISGNSAASIGSHIDRGESSIEFT